MRDNNTAPVSCQVIGAGPAGMSLILALCNRVTEGSEQTSLRERRLLDSLLMFEAGARPGGKMGHYRVNANTNAHDVVKGIADSSQFADLRDRYLGLPQTRSVLIPLREIEVLMVQPLAQAMLDRLGDRLKCNTRIRRVVISERGFQSYDEQDRPQALSRNLLLCCGGREKLLPGLSEFADKTECSGEFLLRDSVKGLPDNRRQIVIVGASHSAYSCAWRLLYDPMFADFAREREIVMLQRRERIKIRCTPEFAKAHDIEYDRDDVCPTTGLVFRNGGLRKDAKMLYLRIRDGEEERVRQVVIEDIETQQELLGQAGLILQATGFGANQPVIEMNAENIEVGRPTVHGELRDRGSDEIIPGLYGLGLGLDIVPDGEARGEPSFNGGIHGFLSYPLSVAPAVIDKLMANQTLGIQI